MMKIRFDVFGTNVYAYGLVHFGFNRFEAKVCGNIWQHDPPLLVHDDEPVTCFKCLTLEVRDVPQS